MVHTCHPSYPRSVNRKIAVQTSPGINVSPYSNNNQAKRTEGMASVQCLLNKQGTEFNLQYGKTTTEKQSNKPPT
jgi:aspartyl aminopeptidase